MACIRVLDDTHPGTGSSPPQELFAAFSSDPCQNPPSFGKLVADLAGAWSRHINTQHRIAYEALANEKAVRVLRIWTRHE